MFVNDIFMLIKYNNISSQHKKKGLKTMKSKQTKTLTIQDADGNIVDERDVEILYGKTKTYYKKGTFFLMNKAFTKFMVDRRDKYNYLTIFLLFELLNRIDFNNRIETFRQVKLAERLKTSQANISRSLKILIEDKVIEKREDDYYFTETFVKFAFDDRGTKK